MVVLLGVTGDATSAFVGHTTVSRQGAYSSNRTSSTLGGCLASTLGGHDASTLGGSAATTLGGHVAAPACWALPRIPDKRWWFCFYWVMGAYVMCGNGLHRLDVSVAAGLLYAVFPRLHKVSDGCVTTQIRNAIKVNLPKKV